MTNIPVAERVHYVGATESPAILGVHRNLTRFELYHRKTGSIPEVDLSENERVQAGRFVEPGLAEWASFKWDMKLRRVRRYSRHPTLAGMGASLDYEEEGTGQGRIPTEFKNVDFIVYRDEYAAEGDEIMDAPLDRLLQVQHQLACVPKAPYAWLVVCVGGNALRRMKVPRHPDTIAKIEAAVAGFWDDVHHDREPKPDFEADAETIRALYMTLNAYEPPVDLTGHNRAEVACAEHLALGARIKELTTKRAGIGAEILTIIDDADKALTRDFKISSWKVGAKDIAFTRPEYRSMRITPIKKKETPK